MSNSVRERNDEEARKILAAKSRALEQQRVQQQAAQVTPVVRGSRNGLVAAAPSTMSTRQRAELAQEAAEVEVLIPPEQRTTASTGLNDPANSATAGGGRVRDRQAVEQAQAEAERGDPPTSDLAEYFIQQHNADEAKLAQWELERQQRQAAVNRKNEEVRQFNARMFPVKLMLREREANEIETKKIWDIAVAHPEYSVDKLYATLLELRRLTAFKSDWKLPEVRRKK